VARRALDTYLTPEDTCTAGAYLLRKHVAHWLSPAIGEPVRILEPAAGSGRLILMALRGLGVSRDNVHVTAVEKNPSWRRQLVPKADEVYCPADFLFWATRCSKRFDLIVGNPPYADLALPFAIQAHRLLRPGGVLFYLLRLGFWESRPRKVWMQAHTPWGQGALSKRPSFTDDGCTDGTAYAWLAWRHGAAPQWMELV